jgi:hypothetical protein
MAKLISLQSIFNKAWRNFVIDGKPPAYENGQCYYNMPDGRRCAIGLSLPPDIFRYIHQLDMSFSEVVVRYPDIFGPCVLALSRDQQDIFQAMLHDDLVSLFTDGWKSGVSLRDEYIGTAARFGLSIPRKKHERS